MHEPIKKLKPSTEINIYREACRDLVAKHPKLSAARRVILMRMTHYINRHTWDVFVSEERLAKDCGAHVRTARRALEDGRTLGIIERTRRGNQYIGNSHYVFKLKTPEVHRTAEAVHRTLQSIAPDRRVRLTSDEHLNKLPREEKIRKEKESGERGPAGPKSEPFPWIDLAFGSATQIYTAPKKFDINLFRAEMATRGLDMAQSRWRRGPSLRGELNA
jgi:hypothetical protein